MKKHFIGATYDLTQENMNGLIQQLEALTAEYNLLKIYYDDLYKQANGDMLTELLNENDKLKHDLEYYKELELRYDELLERIPKLEKQLAAKKS